MTLTFIKNREKEQPPQLIRQHSKHYQMNTIMKSMSAIAEKD